MISWMLATGDAAKAAVAAAAAVAAEAAVATPVAWDASAVAAVAAADVADAAVVAAVASANAVVVSWLIPRFICIAVGDVCVGGVWLVDAGGSLPVGGRRVAACGWRPRVWAARRHTLLPMYVRNLRRRGLPKAAAVGTNRKLI